MNGRGDVIRIHDPLLPKPPSNHKDQGLSRKTGDIGPQWFQLVIRCTQNRKRGPRNPEKQKAAAKETTARKTKLARTGFVLSRARIFKQSANDPTARPGSI